MNKGNEGDRRIILFGLSGQVRSRTAGPVRIDGQMMWSCRQKLGEHGSHRKVGMRHPRKNELLLVVIYEIYQRHMMDISHK